MAVYVALVFFLLFMDICVSVELKWSSRKLLEQVTCSNYITRLISSGTHGGMIIAETVTEGNGTATCAGRETMTAMIDETVIGTREGRGKTETTALTIESIVLMTETTAPETESTAPEIRTTEEVDRMTITILEMVGTGRLLCMGRLFKRMLTPLSDFLSKVVPIMCHK